MSRYPPEPWQLRGQLHTSVFLVPLALVAAELPPECRPVRLGRCVVVGVAWVDYQPGGVLSYRELMATVLVRRGWRVMPTITHIWVDSVASRDGGRALWAVPKEVAEFTVDGSRWTARDESGPIAAATVRRRWQLPGRWPLRFAVVQPSAGAAKVSPVRVVARLGLSSVAFRTEQAGPLGFLAGRRALPSLTLADFRMSFGHRQTAVGAGDRGGSGVE